MNIHAGPPALLVLFAAALLVPAAGCSSSQHARQAEARSNEAPEMVEVGYGQQDKDKITGSVATIDADKARKERPAATVSDLLRGRVAGVVVSESPGGGIMVRIRGARSFYGSADPLYVVDGFPVQADPGGTLSFINPHDIKSISVLKDASATAIYGARGANGVILIVTKQGRE